MAASTLQNYIGGNWVPSKSNQTLDVKNPATGEILAKVPLSVSADVDAAVAAAGTAFPAWRATPPVQRARVLFKFKALLDANKDAIARICTAEHGKTLAESQNDIGRGIENVEHACGTPTAAISGRVNTAAATVRSLMGCSASPSA